MHLGQADDVMAKDNIFIFLYLFYSQLRKWPRAGAGKFSWLGVKVGWQLGRPAW